MEDIEIAQGFFSDDDKKSEMDTDEVSLFHRMLTLPASSSEWQESLDDLSVEMMQRLIDAYQHQEGRSGAIKILERRLKKRGSEPKPKEPQPVQVETHSEPEVVRDEKRGWFPQGWKEARQALIDSKVEPPMCYMCKPVFDALVNNTGIFDDKWGTEDSQVCKKENVLWHWNVCFCRMKKENERFRIGA